MSLSQSEPNHLVDDRVLISFASNALIIFTTIYAQDFRDTEGDYILGRRTLPLVWPEASRIAIFVSLTLWSVGLSIICHVNTPAALAFSVLGFGVGLRFYLRRSAADDRRTYVWYNVSCQPYYLDCMSSHEEIGEALVGGSAGRSYSDRRGATVMICMPFARWVLGLREKIEHKITEPLREFFHPTNTSRLALTFRLCLPACLNLLLSTLASSS